MKNTGIWIDKRKAIVITIENDKEQMHTITSNIEDYNIKGGSGTKFKGGPQDVVQDSKYLEREKHQFKAYFNDIVPYFESADAVIIFGPAQAGAKLNKELLENYTNLHSKVKSVITTDKMTDNQLKAFVRAHFESA